MSTTSTFQGIDTGAKPSSRVLAPPGGGGSNIFGHYQDEAPAQRRKETPKGSSDVFNQHAAQGPPAAQETRSQRSNQKIGEDSFRLFNNDISNNTPTPRRITKKYENLTSPYAVGAGDVSQTPRSARGQSKGLTSPYAVGPGENIPTPRSARGQSKDLTSPYAVGPGENIPTPRSARGQGQRRENSFNSVFGDHSDTPTRLNPKYGVRKSSSHNRVFGPDTPDTPQVRNIPASKKSNASVAMTESLRTVEIEPVGQRKGPDSVSSMHDVRRQGSHATIFGSEVPQRPQSGTKKIGRKSDSSTLMKEAISVSCAESQMPGRHEINNRGGASSTSLAFSPDTPDGPNVMSNKMAESSTAMKEVLHVVDLPTDSKAAAGMAARQQHNASDLINPKQGLRVADEHAPKESSSSRSIPPGLASDSKPAAGKAGHQLHNASDLINPKQELTVGDESAPKESSPPRSLSVTTVQPDTKPAAGMAAHQQHNASDLINPKQELTVADESAPKESSPPSSLSITSLQPEVSPSKHFSVCEEEKNSSTSFSRVFGDHDADLEATYNPITGEPIEPAKPKEVPEEKKEEEKKEEAAAPAQQKPAPAATAQERPEQEAFRSTRVSQPPGGRSTALW